MKKKLILLVGAFLLLTGCSSVNGLRRNYNEGKTITIKGKTYDEVWGASIRALREDLVIVYSDKEHGDLKAKTSNNDLNNYSTSWGEIVGVFIEKTGDKEYRVNIQSKEKLKTTAFGTDWSQGIAAGIEAELY